MDNRRKDLPEASDDEKVRRVEEDIELVKDATAEMLFELQFNKTIEEQILKEVPAPNVLNRDILTKLDSLREELEWLHSVTPEMVRDHDKFERELTSHLRKWKQDERDGEEGGLEDRSGSSAH